MYVQLFSGKLLSLGSGMAAVCASARGFSAAFCRVCALLLKVIGASRFVSDASVLFGM